MALADLGAVAGLAAMAGPEVMGLRVRRLGALRVRAVAVAAGRTTTTSDHGLAVAEVSESLGRGPVEPPVLQIQRTVKVKVALAGHLGQPLQVGSTVVAVA